MYDSYFNHLDVVKFLLQSNAKTNLRKNGNGALVDRNDNFIYLGQIGTVSLVLTTIGLINASIYIFEGYEENPKVEKHVPYNNTKIVKGLTKCDFFI